LVLAVLVQQVRPEVEVLVETLRLALSLQMVVAVVVAALPHLIAMEIQAVLVEEVLEQETQLCQLAALAIHLQLPHLKVILAVMVQTRLLIILLVAVAVHLLLEHLGLVLKQVREAMERLVAFQVHLLLTQVAVAVAHNKRGQPLVRAVVAVAVLEGRLPRQEQQEQQTLEVEVEVEEGFPHKVAQQAALASSSSHILHPHKLLLPLLALVRL
jgi:hypothetical protein